MLLYGMIMFAAAVTFAVLAVRIYKGKTELIHDYHQTNVKDKSAYGKAFGKALAVMAVAMALSGGVAFLGEPVAPVSVAVLLTGLGIGIVAIVRVQKKYNGSIF